MKNHIEEWLDQHMYDIRVLENEAGKDPGYCDTDFDMVPSKVYTKYIRALHKIRVWLYNLSSLDDWLAVAGWCGQNGDDFGEAEEGICVNWNKKATALNLFLLEVIRDRLRMRTLYPEDEQIWKDPRVTGLMTETKWSMINRLTNDLMLLQTIHLLGNEGINARVILTEKQRDIINYMDSLRSYFTVEKITMSMDSRFAGFKVEFINQMPQDIRIGIGAFLFKNGKVGEPLHKLDLNIVSLGENDGFIASSYNCDGKIDKGSNWVSIFRKKKGWNIKPGKPIVFYLKISSLNETDKKERFGERWFYLPSPGYFCATAVSPQLKL